MNEITASSVFKPAPSRQEAKTDATTRAAREIIAGEEARRVAKTERLRAARLAHPRAEEALPEKTAKKRVRKTR